MSDDEMMLRQSKFEAWLDSLPPKHPLNRRDSYSCPIATWLNEKYAVNVSTVGRNSVHVPGIGWANHQDWSNAFVRIWDDPGRVSRGSREEALFVMQDIRDAS